MALDATPHLSEIDSDHLVDQIDELARQTSLLALDAMLTTMGNDAIPSAEAAHSTRALANRLSASIRKAEVHLNVG